MGGLKMGVGFLIVVTLVLLGFSTATAQSTWPDFWRVDIINGLSGGQTLFVHCKSGDDDLGEHTLGAEVDYNWTFKDNIWATTLFWCFLRKPNNVSASFDANWCEKSQGHWLYQRCDWKNCIWTAKDDGIYLKNIPLNQDELIHKWG